MNSIQCIKNVSIRAISACVPATEINNNDLQKFSSEEKDKIIESTGVHQRRVVKNACASDLCYVAAKNILGKLNCPLDSIDVLIFVSQTPDYILPATACVLHHRLGLSKKVMAFDINLGCSGYTYGLIVLAQLLSSGIFKKGLLLAGDTSSKLVSEEDRSVAFLFGDAGSATLLEFDPTAAPIFFDYGTDGAGYDKLIVEAGAFRLRANAQTQERHLDEQGNYRAKSDLLMSGVDIFTFTLKEVAKSIVTTFTYANWSKDEVDYYLFHQANEFMLKHLIKKLAITDVKKTPMSLKNYGNTSVTSIPLTLCQEAHQFLAQHSYKILMTGFGVGFSWSSVASTIKNIIILPLFIYEDEKKVSAS